MNTNMKRETPRAIPSALLIALLFSKKECGNSNSAREMHVSIPTWREAYISTKTAAMLAPPQRLRLNRTKKEVMCTCSYVV